MSRTRRGSKGPGYEYWGRRPCSGWNPSKETKVIAHQIERAREKELIHEAIKELEEGYADKSSQTG